MCAYNAHPHCRLSLLLCFIKSCTVQTTSHGILATVGLNSRLDVIATQLFCGGEYLGGAGTGRAWPPAR